MHPSHRGHARRGRWFGAFAREGLRNREYCARRAVGYTLRVNTDAMVRLIEVVRRELGADDARFELGGRDPEDDHLVWISLPHGFRAVAVFTEVPAGREILREKLRLLLASFSGIG